MFLYRAGNQLRANRQRSFAVVLNGDLHWMHIIVFMLWMQSVTDNEVGLGLLGGTVGHPGSWPQVLSKR